MDRSWKSGPGERSLNVLDERRLLTGVYVARLAIANALAIAATWVRATTPTTTTPLPLAVVVVGIPLVFTMGSILYTRRRPIGRRFLVLQVAHDLALTTVAVVFTGGVGSEFAFIYVLLIAVSGLLLGFSGAVLAAAGSAAAYLAVAWTQIGTLVPDAGGLIELPNLSARAPEVAWSLTLTAAVFLLVGAFSGLAARRLRAQRARLEELEVELASTRIDAQDILNTVESGILSVDADEEIDFVNTTARTMLGLGRSPTSRDLRRHGAAELLDLLLETFRSEWEIEFVEMNLPDARGETRALSVATTVLYDAGGRKRGAAAILKDVLHVQRLEDLARQADRLKAVAELAAGLAHEIQNPLSAIRSAVELLGSNEAEEGEEERLRALVLRETDRLTALVRDFMAFSRTTLRTRERVDFVDVVDDALEVARLSSRDGDVALEFERPSEPQWVEGDHNLLKQVCLNLFDNAREASRRTGADRVRIVLGGDPELPGIERAAGPYVALLVEDEGPGVDPEAKDRIFDPFFTTRSGGFGMGLAIVHRIVDLHGGVVWVDSGADHGAAFRVALPRVDRP